MSNKLIKFELSPHSRVCFFNQKLICLDLKRDKYIFFQDDIASSLEIALSQYFYQHPQSFEYIPVNNVSIMNNGDSFKILNEHLSLLIDEEIIMCSQRLEKSIALIEKKTYLGCQDINWRMNLRFQEGVISKALIVESLYTLLKVNWILTLKGIYGLIKIINNIASKKSLKTADIESYTKLAMALDKASLFFPIKTKCLEWAIAMQLMCFKRNWKCSLNIGVQTPPFFAHAWCSVNDIVLHDDKDLPIKLATILQEPRGDNEQ